MGTSGEGPFHESVEVDFRRVADSRKSQYCRTSWSVTGPRKRGSVPGTVGKVDRSVYGAQTV